MKTEEEKKNCTDIIESISMMNPFDEQQHHRSTSKDSAMHRVTVDTPEDVFLIIQIFISIKENLLFFFTYQLSVWLLTDHYW